MKRSVGRASVPATELANGARCAPYAKNFSEQSELMSQTRAKQTISARTIISPEPSTPRLGREHSRGDSDSPQTVEDLIPYSAKDLQYLWALWDEAPRHHQPGRRDRNICGGAVGVTLAGWLIYGLGLSGSLPLGGILMLAGAIIAAWFGLKSLDYNGPSAPGG
jgi:hypothetical protein